jgi:IclR family acetate operon transcriptional repressor
LRFLRRTDLARPLHRYLREATGENANLGIQQNGFVPFVSPVETDANIDPFFPRGTFSRSRGAGIGKALLAERRTCRIEKHRADAPPERFTEFTLIGREAVMGDFHHTWEHRFAMVGEERNLRMRCIAAPISDIHAEAIAAISVPGPASQARSDQIPTLSAATLAAAKLSAMIGSTLARRQP